MCVTWLLIYACVAVYFFTHKSNQLKCVLCMMSSRKLWKREVKSQAVEFSSSKRVNHKALNIWRTKLSVIHIVNINLYYLKLIIKNELIAETRLHSCRYKATHEVPVLCQVCLYIYIYIINLTVVLWFCILVCQLFYSNGWCNILTSIIHEHMIFIVDIWNIEHTG